MTFIGLADSEFPIRMDSRLETGGDDSGVRPMELLLIGLGGCTGMDVISILRKKRQNITHFEIQLDATQAEDYPRIFTHITINYKIHGHNVDPKAVARAIELSVTKYCPAQAMLDKAAEIEHTYEIVEEG